MRNRLEYLAYRAGSAVVRALPLAWMQAAGAAFARLAFDLDGKRGRYTRINLGIVMPTLSEAERLRIGRESFVHFAWNVIDFARAEYWSEEELREHVSIEGLEHLRSALAQGKGVIGLLGHIGNFELGVRRFGIEGFETDAIGRMMRNELLYERVTRARTSAGGTVIDRKNAAPHMLRALRANRVVGVLVDQYARRAGAVMVPFFGVRCLTAAGVAMIALRTGAPIVPIYVERDGPDHHSSHILAPLEVERTGQRRRDIESVTARCNAALEAMIRPRPEQWMWGHRRFRHSPDLPDEPYGPRRTRRRRL